MEVCKQQRRARVLYLSRWLCLSAGPSSHDSRWYLTTSPVRVLETTQHDHWSLPQGTEHSKHHLLSPGTYEAAFSVAVGLLWVSLAPPEKSSWVKWGQTTAL